MSIEEIMWQDIFLSVFWSTCCLSFYSIHQSFPLSVFFFPLSYHSSFFAGNKLVCWHILVVTLFFIYKIADYFMQNLKTKRLKETKSGGRTENLPKPKLSSSIRAKRICHWAKHRVSAILDLQKDRGEKTHMRAVMRKKTESVQRGESKSKWSFYKM